MWVIKPKKKTKKTGCIIIVTPRFGRCLEDFSFVFILTVLFCAGSFGLAGVVRGDPRDKGVKFRVFVFRVFLRCPGGPGGPGVNQAQVFCQGCLRCKSLRRIKGILILILCRFYDNFNFFTMYKTWLSLFVK